MHFFNSYQTRLKACLYGALTLLLIWVLSLNYALYCNAQTIIESTTDIYHTHIGDNSTNSGCYTVPIYHEHEGNSSGGGCYSTPNYHAHEGNTSGGGCYTLPNYHVHTGSSSGGGCYTSANVHYHSGNSSSGGGCYTVKSTTSHNSGCNGGAYCGQGPYGPDTSGQIYYVATCPVCLAHLSTYNNPGYVSCPNAKYETITTYSLGCGMSSGQVLNYSLGCGKDGSSIDSYSLGCGKDESTVDSYSLGCEKDETTIEGYDTGCGMSEDTPVGSFTVEKSSDDWSTEITLEMHVDPESMVDSDNPFSVNDNDCGFTYTVTEDGSYEIVPNTTEGFVVSPITIVINNIDTQGPDVSYEYDHTHGIAKTVLVVTAADIMADGRPGCGLADEAYSYDNGTTWTGDNTYPIDKNQVIHLLVRDKLGNTSSQTITIDNIVIPVPPKADNSSSSENSSVESASNQEDLSSVSDSLNMSEDASIIPVAPVTSGTKIKSPNSSSGKKGSAVFATTGSGNTKTIVTPPLTKEKLVEEKESLQDNTVVSRTIETPDTSENIDFIKLFLAIIIGLAIAGLIFLIFFLLCRIVVISGFDHDDVYNLKGFALIHNKSDAFEVNIPASIIDKCDTNRLRLRFSAFFIATHKESDVVIYLPNKRSHVVRPGKKVKISFTS